MRQAVTPAIHVEVVQGGFIITTEDADDRLRGEQSVTAGSLDDLTCVLQSMAYTHVVELVEKIKDAPEEFPGHPASDEPREEDLRELQREVDEAREELGAEYPEPTHEEARSFRSLMDKVKQDTAYTFAYAAGPALKAQVIKASGIGTPQAQEPQPRCDTCDDTGWVARGTIRSGVPFSHNYMACPKGCDGGRGFSDPIPYDKATGKIVTDTEDDGA